ncbi:hypothetical protein K1T71_011629 [Dendrolimus kikuchii]|uniref:Uncharacterized protein n=1 Tax=Dendrolimus kikuchii TaxID=765133 RepID=A0ACC1CLL2_9NEOP|nr:hypothetical protein K1T71_011629 [Dendrolimus kikuchii]
MELERTELLGSLTTLQQQRTSARVIKKLRLEPPGEKRLGKRPDGTCDDVAECETPSKMADEKDPLKFPTVKQRMPKALWSTDEKSLFFEALNEYGKDFDAITAHICAKMKKKGMPDVNLKTKTQVSHFYYRTWHKLSKHVHFDEKVKKVAQELYALINYGELRKKLVSVNEKTCARLGEMVLGGSMVVRARGRNLRVRTPMCRALRRLNQITERACGSRVCSRAQVMLRARDVCAWARVQAAAHNPRAAVALPLRTRLAAFIHALQKRWRGKTHIKHIKIESQAEQKCIEEVQSKEADENFPELSARVPDDNEQEDLEDHLNMEPERIIVQEQKLSKKPALHVGPRPEAEIHIPLVSPSEQLSSQKICFSSYLERMCSQRRDKDETSAKIRTPKRQRKDSTTEVKDTEPKKFKIDESDTNRLINIEETAIDGIELMASFKNNQDDEEKPSTEEELKSEETAEEEVDREPERDKDMSEREKDSFSEMEDDEKYNKSDTDNESDHGKEKGKENKFKNLKVKFRIRPKKRGGSIYTLVVDKDQEESKEDQVKVEDEPKPDIDVDMALRQIRKGWSVHDAGDLSIGDLYLMFGSRSKLELDYWWAEPTPPLPQPVQKVPKADPASDKRDKSDKTPDKGTDSSVEDDRGARESDTDIFSPKNAFSQDSNDGISGDERKNEQLASPEHKLSSTSCSGTLKLVSKLINRPQQAAPVQNGFAVMSDRLKRLLSLVGNPYMTPTPSPAVGKCGCGHVCPQKKPKPPQPQDSRSAVFRHPPPIAPKVDVEPPTPKPLNLEDVPRWRRGRARVQDRPVVVQRLLPLLPKLPPPSKLIPVKIMPHPPATLPRILPKPPPTQSSDFPCYYVLSETNGQFFFHDGDRRIPISNIAEEANDGNGDTTLDVHTEAANIKNEREENTETTPSQNTKESPKEGEPNVDTPANEQKANPDIGNFLPSESMSLSPSRLLREAEGWMGGEHDFSLSSFLSHLEGRPHQDLGVDSQLQSLMAESSVDYVAKFADLAAEVTDEVHLPTDDMP